VTDKRVEPQASHRLRLSCQSARSCWQSGQTRTCVPPATARAHGTSRLSGSKVGRWQRKQPGRSGALTLGGYPLGVAAGPAVTDAYDAVGELGTARNRSVSTA
jgi:hypothetical protein